MSSFKVLLILYLIKYTLLLLLQYLPSAALISCGAYIIMTGKGVVLIQNRRALRAKYIKPSSPLIAKSDHKDLSIHQIRYMYFSRGPLFRLHLCRSLKLSITKYSYRPCRHNHAYNMYWWRELILILKVCLFIPCYSCEVSLFIFDFPIVQSLFDYSWYCAVYFGTMYRYRKFGNWGGANIGEKNFHVHVEQFGSITYRDYVVKCSVRSRRK